MEPLDREEILNILDLSDVKLTVLSFLKEIKSRYALSFSEAKKILQSLVDGQELSYHDLYGSTYIEKSFLKPVRISRHFILRPPGVKTTSLGSDIEIMMEQGLSFGSGRHPTTRLCLEAIEFCMFEDKRVGSDQNLVAADIGTGSGVLAIALCRAGLKACTAYEIDPVAINEARRNVKLNGLAGKINVIESPVTEHRNRFSIICANLRYPTLASLADIMYAGLKKDGIAVLSGVREWEKDLLLDCYSEKRFHLLWQKDEKKWSAFVLAKKTG